MTTSDYLSLRLVDVGNGHARLDCRLPGNSALEERTFPLGQISSLLRQAEQDYYVAWPDIEAIGRKLFIWLDGDERWLTRAVEQGTTPLLVLQLDVQDKGLRHLPWEALHDGTQFLVQRPRPVVTVRCFPGPSQGWQVRERLLQMVFMAGSPEGVEPPLDFEAEESAILKATATLPLQVRVEESGNLEQLSERLRRYGAGNVDILHLTGHAGLKEDSPFFVLEDETGERQDATAREITERLQLLLPPLVFLSGCRTGQAGLAGAIPSMAEALVQAGARAVLGWGLPIADTIATIAAAELYTHLVSGMGLAEALAKTYLRLLKSKAPNWHLLRLYVRDQCPGALVAPPGDIVYQTQAPAAELFLDPQQRVRVATVEQFVGRRRFLQRGVKTLRGGDYLGLVIHGLGGLGKSSLAVRLLERLSGYDRVVLYRDLDADRLTNLLSCQCESEEGHKILNSSLPTMQKWSRFFKRGLNSPNQRFAIVLDDFEANLESNIEGKQVLKAGVVEVLKDLLEALKQSGLSHRLLITSRYDFTILPSQLSRQLARLPLVQLQGADLLKKCDRLESFKAGANVDEISLQEALKLAAGNPRLLERLDRVLQDRELDQQTILKKLDATKVEFREEILVELLLAQQVPELRRMLECGRIYELPVPREAFVAVCVNLDESLRHIERAGSLGLLEVGLGESLRVSQLVISIAPEPQRLAKFAVDALYHYWWKSSRGCTEAQALEIHRLAWLAEDAEKILEVADILSRRWYEQGRYHEAEPLLQQALEINGQLLGEDHPSVAPALSSLAALYQAQGRYSEAEPRFQKALEMSKKLLGKEHPDVAAALNNLARLYQAQGHYEQAEPLHLQALEMKKQLLGEEHLDVATSLNNLAGLYQSQGRYKEAEPLNVQALEMRRRLLGEEHPDVAASLNNQALLYYSQGRYSDAEPLFRQALEIKRRLLGEEHPLVASSLNSLAGLYQSQGRYEEAELLNLQALEMRRRLFSEEHPLVALSLNNLAGLYQSQGRYKEAEPLYVQALEMRKRLLGEEHPDVAGSLNNLGGLYQSQGRYDEAEPFVDQALEMRQRLFGKKHPDVASSLNSLAVLYQSQGRYGEAEPLLQQALKINRQLLGEEHPGIATSLNNLAFLYQTQGRNSEAEPLFRQALEMRQRLLGKEHPDIATSFNSLAELYRLQGRYEEAEPLHVQALEMRQKLLGNEHLDVANSFNNLALLYQLLGRYGEAEPLYVQALEIHRQLLGEEHSDIATSLNNLALHYQTQGRNSDAEPLFRQALEMRQRLLGKEHLDMASPLYGLAGIYQSQGCYSDAEPLFRQALEICIKRLGPEHPSTTAVMHNYRSVLIKMGKLSQ